MPITSLQGEQGRRVRAAFQRMDQAFAAEYGRSVLLTPQIMTSLHGHPREGVPTRWGWVYDNEPWHWPPKERSVPMGITQEQYERSIEIRTHIELQVLDAINELREDGDISIKDKVESRIVEAVADQLLLAGLIDLAKVEERL